GSIRSDVTSAVLYRTKIVEAATVNTDSNSAVQHLDHPWLGPVVRAAPDLPLHLSIGTPQHFGGTDLCFTARIEGAVVGTVGVIDVLRTLLLSRPVGVSGQQQCHAHAAPSALQVLNVKASWWARDRYVKPVS